MCLILFINFQLFVWKNGQFEDLEEELGIPDVAKTVAWAGDSVCVGFRKDYYLIKVFNFFLISYQWSTVLCIVVWVLGANKISSSEISVNVWQNKFFNSD